MSEVVTYEAAIPAQPAGLEIVVDRDGDAWQRITGEDAWRGDWRCVRAKVPGLLVGSNSIVSWRHLVYAFGPLNAVKWASKDGAA